MLVIAEDCVPLLLTGRSFHTFSFLLGLLSVGYLAFASLL